MKRLVAIHVFLLLLISGNGTANAFVFDNANCAVCHASPTQLGSVRPGAIEVLGEGLLNLDGVRNDGIRRGAIPVFTAQPGEAVELISQVLDGDNRYAVAINNFEADSVTGAPNTSFLTGYSPDPGWSSKNPPPTPIFYTNVDNSTSALDWPASDRVPPATFRLTLSPNTPLATYELEFSVAGIVSFQPRPKFVDSQFFYLQVVSLLEGDYNDDGVVNAADYTVWRDNLGRPPGSLPNDVDGGVIRQAQYATWKANIGSTAATSASIVPEPTSTAILLVAISALASWRFVGSVDGRGSVSRPTS